MRLTIKVVPGSKVRRLVKEEQGVYKVWLNSPPEGGKANNELREYLAEHFQVKKNQVQIILGHKNRNKLVEIKQ